MRRTRPPRRVPVWLLGLLAVLAVALGWHLWHGGWPLWRGDWSHEETAFRVQGQTTSLVFYAGAQDESAEQAGIFASPDRPVNLQVSCSTLRRSGSTDRLSCPNGVMALQHIAVSFVRLGEGTKVALHIEGRDLSMTLLENPQSPSVVTLFSDERTRDGATHKALAAGEWTVEEESPAVNITFLAPHFEADTQEGGQVLVKGKALGFEQNGVSGFKNDSGKVILLLAGDQRKEVPLHDGLLRISSTSRGRIQSLSPVSGPDGTLQALRVEVTGDSGNITLSDDLDSEPHNLALSMVGRHAPGLRSAKAHLFELASFLASVASLATFAFERLKNRRAA